VRDTKQRPGKKETGGDAIGANGSYKLPEPEISYGGDFAFKNDDLRQ
jgi:hypothetical protein